MKPITFSTKSWHFRLVDKFIGLPSYKRENVDFCQYTRQLVRCLAMVALAAAAAYWGILLPAGDGMAWIVAGLQYGFVMPSDPARLFVVELLCALVAIMGWITVHLALWIATYRSERRDLNTTQANSSAPPSFIRVLYHKVKEKTCVRVNFE